MKAEEKKSFNILILPGDGIGPEVIAEAEKILRCIAEFTGVSFEIEKGIVGGESIDRSGVPITSSVLTMAKSADAILLGAVGGPKWENLPMSKKPEQALLKLRYELSVWANLRPVKLLSPIIDISPLKHEVISGTDMLVVRELTGDVYFGKPRKKTKTKAFNTMVYTRGEIKRVAKLSFEIARERRKKVTSVDKANILETSELWREVVTEVGSEYSDVSLEHMYVDAFSMRMITDPKHFDVVLTSNMFGDIISDEGGGLLGSLGLCPSGSLGEGRRGLYEPVHGSAPDIAGRGIANPVASILSTALMLQYSFGMSREAMLIERAVEETLKEGKRTPDIAKGKPVSTEQMGNEIVVKLGRFFKSDDFD